MSLYVPSHELPVKKAGIAASHDIHDLQGIDDIIAARDYAHYVRNGLMPSLKFTRCADSILDGYDENKAVFPIFHRVPLFCIPTISCLEQGMQVSVVGNHDIGVYVHALRNYYSSIYEFPDLTWVPEADNLSSYANCYRAIVEQRKKITAGSNFSRLAKALFSSRNDAMLWCAGDVIAYNFRAMVNDTDIEHNAIVMDLNGMETIKPEVPRNTYHVFITADGKKVHVKEANCMLIGAECSSEAHDAVYSSRTKGGFGAKAFLAMAGSNILHNPETLRFKDVGLLAKYSMSELSALVARRFGINASVVYHEQGLQQLGRFVYMTPIRIKATHTDILKLKDVDALHDYVLLRALLEHHIDEVLPANIASKVKGFNDFLVGKPLKRRVPIIEDLPVFLNDKVRRVAAILKSTYGIDYGKELPFAPDGTMREIFGQGESIDALLRRCKADLDKYCSN